MLLLRGGNRYVSKGNYNVTRIEYLADLLPDARFVVPVRHPVAHVESLMRQHELFSEYSARDGRVAEYLRAAGHFEFGPQRVPVNIDPQDARQIADAWSAGEDDLGYAVMWRSVYSHVSGLMRMRDDLATRIALIRYEDLCEDTDGALRRLARFCELDEGIDALLERMPEVVAAGTRFLPALGTAARKDLGRHGRDCTIPRLQFRTDCDVSTDTGEVASHLLGGELVRNCFRLRYRRRAVQDFSV